MALDADTLESLERVAEIMRAKQHDRLERAVRDVLVIARAFLINDAGDLKHQLLRMADWGEFKDVSKRAFLEIARLESLLECPRSPTGNHAAARNIDVCRHCLKLIPPI